MDHSLNNSLDSTLPLELQNLVKYGGPLDISRAVAAEERPTEKTMATEVTADTKEQIKAIASQTVNELLGEKNKELALANKFEVLYTEINTHKLATAAVTEELATAKKKIVDAMADCEASKKKVEEATAAAKKSEDDKVDIIKKFSDAKASNDLLTKQLSDINAEKTVASRKDMLDKKKLMSKARADKACARDEKGEFVMSEASFNEYVADLESAVTEATAAAKTESIGAPKVGSAAPDGPKSDKQIDNKESPHGKPTGAKAGTDDEQDNEGGKVTKAKASEEVVPAAPNLGGAEIIARAQASLLSPPQPVNKTRVNLFADAFRTGN